MTKARLQYVCQSCGYVSPKWLGRCPACGAWNSLVEEMEHEVAAAGSLPPALPVVITDVVAAAEPRLATGFRELDRVLGGGLVPGSLVLIGGDPGIGKCIVGETRVLDPRSGEYLPIAEFGEGDRSVVSLDESTQRCEMQRATAFYPQGIRPVVLVTTRLGRILRCTPNHPVLTPDGWKPVGELSRGTRIAAPRILPYFGKNAMAEVEVKAIAYFLADGLAASTCTGTAALPEVEADLARLAQKFRLHLRVYPNPNNRAKDSRFVQPRGEPAKVGKRLAAALRRVHRKSGLSWAAWARKAGVNDKLLCAWNRDTCVPGERELRQLALAAGVPGAELSADDRGLADMKTGLARFLESVGQRSEKASTKAVPQCIFRLPRNQLALFLRVLFSRDGSLYVTGQSVAGISYSTISHRLAEDVQHLLLRFGFRATLRTKQMRVSGRPYRAYELQLSGVATVRRFLSEIGIWGRERAKARLEMLPQPRVPSTRSDTVSTGEEFWRHLKRATGGISFLEISARAGVTLRNRRRDRPLIRSTGAALARAFPTPFFSKLADGDISWDEIEAVTAAGSAEVYDLSVLPHHNFIANDMIVHNSTLLLEACRHLGERGRQVLYVSGEESVTQVKLRADRLGVATPHLLLLAETNLEAILGACEQARPQVVVVDSIQTVYKPDLPSAPGSVGQVRECTADLMRMAKNKNVSVFIVGHVTKEGQLAGPRVLEHIVDTVLYFEGDRHHAYRVIRATKNRFGPTNEIGVFEMRTEGLREVPNPSAVFLSERTAEAPGSVVVCAMEGTRPLLVEVQALVTPTVFGMPRRTAAGVDYNRMIVLLAVLEKRAGLHLSSHDVYVSVAGGISMDEPAADLGVATAVASSLRDRRVDATAVDIGEVGLAGEIRVIPQLEARAVEAARMGLRRCIVPKPAAELDVAGIVLVPVEHIGEALAQLIP